MLSEAFFCGFIHQLKFFYSRILLLNNSSYSRRKWLVTGHRADGSGWSSLILDVVAQSAVRDSHVPHVA